MSRGSFGNGFFCKAYVTDLVAKLSVEQLGKLFVTLPARFLEGELRRVNCMCFEVYVLNSEPSQKAVHPGDGAIVEVHDRILSETPTPSFEKAPKHQNMARLIGALPRQRQ